VAAQAHDMKTSIGLLVLRLGAGGFMALHGWGKVKMVAQGQFDQFGDPIGLGPAASLVLAALAEFLCAILVILGVGTRLAALPVVFTMAVAAFVVHRADPWTTGGGYARFVAGESNMPLSKEPALLFLVVFLALALAGAGRYSLGTFVWRKLAKRAAAVG
jgi:putative oxidoreductase